MSYRYKQDFGKCFNGLPLPQNDGAISHPLIELDEVYRKAEAFDEIAEIPRDGIAIDDAFYKAEVLGIITGSESEETQ